MNYRAAAEELREFVEWNRDRMGAWLVRKAKRLQARESLSLVIPPGHYNLKEPIRIIDPHNSCGTQVSGGLSTNQTVLLFP